MNKLILVVLLLEVVAVSCAPANQQDDDPSLSVFLESLQDGNHFHMRVNLSSTVEALMSAVHELGYFNAPLDRTVLLYAGRAMESGHTLHEYGIKRHSHIGYVTCKDVDQSGAANSSDAATDDTSESNGVRLLIKYLATGNVFPLLADPRGTVRALKERIRQTGGHHFPTDAQVLLTGQVALSDDSILADYDHIKEDKTIGLVVCEKHSDH